MLLHPYKKPEIVGALDPQFFTDLGENFPNTYTEIAWQLVNPKSDNPELLAALQPLTKFIIDSELEITGPPHAIVYQVDTWAVPPSEPQYTDNWHFDSRRQASMVVADALPTEFLVRKSGAGKRGAFAARHNIAKAFADARPGAYLDLEGITDLGEIGLGVFQPEPYQIARMKSQVHRTPVNATEANVPRVWVRAAPLHHTPANLL